MLLGARRVLSLTLTISRHVVSLNFLAIVLHVLPSQLEADCLSKPSTVPEASRNLRNLAFQGTAPGWLTARGELVESVMIPLAVLLRPSRMFPLTDPFHQSFPKTLKS